MASIESSIGKVSSTERAPLKKFVVDDPSLEEEKFEEKVIADPGIALSQANALRRAKEESLTKEKKSKLELLLGLKRTKTSIVIDGHTIVLQNLSSGDMKTAYKKIAQQELYVDQMFDTRHVFLAYSLYSFDGETISSLLGEDDELETRLSLIENMSESVIKELYDFYTKSFEEVHPKTEEQFKEVAADIKK